MNKFRSEYNEDSEDYSVYWEGEYIGDVLPKPEVVGTHEANFKSDAFISSAALRAVADFVDEMENLCQ